MTCLGGKSTTIVRCLDCRDTIPIPMCYTNEPRRVAEFHLQYFPTHTLQLRREVVTSFIDEIIGPLSPREATK